MTGRSTTRPAASEVTRRSRRFSILLATSDAVADRVSSGEPGMLIPAGAVVKGSLLGAFVDEIARWGAAVPPAGRRVCPFVPAALNANAVLIGSSEPTEDTDELVSWVIELIELFPLVEEAFGEDGQLVSLVLRVPFDDGVVGSEIVETAHHNVESLALDHGLLPGEFGREIRGSGTRFVDIETRRSAVGETLVLRKLLPADRKYVVGRMEWRERYERRFSRGRAT